MEVLSMLYIAIRDGLRNIER